MQNSYTDDIRSHTFTVEDDAHFWRSLILRLVLLAALVSALSHASAAFAADASPNEEVASLPLGLDIDVRVMCTTKHVAFSFQNDGSDWPKRAQIAVLKDASGQVLSQRSLNMKQGQNVTFRVKTGGLNMGDLGLDVRADWISPKDQRQITVNCDLSS